MESAFRDAGDVKLIETLGWNGQAFARLPLHLARLEWSAQRLGWVCNLAEAEAELRKGATGKGSARVRMTLDAFGVFEVSVAPLPATKPVWRVGLAQERLDSGDPWLGIKSTRRGAYDRARADLRDGLDEVVFLNERGEVCDGTITTVFYDWGDGVCTPPLSCGLLPGVLRAEMLACGLCREKVATAHDLSGVRLWVGNSLRGLIPAVWTDLP